MAEGQDAASTAQEPSMEEILASIRKIISDDDAPAIAPASAEAAPAPVDDVIELTQMVQDDGSIVDVKSLPPEETPMAVEPPPMPVVAPAPAPAPEKALVSENIVSASANSLSALANTVEIERLASAPLVGASLGNGGRTLEDMVLELMRPLLKDWLEKNLPATVDRLVQKEIERIARKAQN